MDGGKEGSSVFGVTGGGSTLLFEIKKFVFDEMAQLVEVLVVGTLNGSVFLGRDETAFMPCPVACSRIASVS